jgi:hypothetical protein
MPESMSEINQRAATVSIVDIPVLILVGVTGVGKSTTLAALNAAGFGYLLLPDRRELTDRMIIARLQVEDQETIRPITDRAERFDYTRRYRERYGGGMAHALTSLRVDKETAQQTRLFDGLRGADEVRYAAEHLPQARFLVLDAPDVLRVERLLTRRDAFDQIAATAPTDTSNIFANLPGVDEFFGPTEKQHLRGLVDQGDISADDLRTKLSIVITERRNYDPSAAITELTRLAMPRTLVVNTAETKPEEVAQQVIEFWKA